MKHFGNCSILLAAAFSSGCIMTMHVVEHYDDECQIYTRHVVLDPQQAGSMGSCNETARCISNLVGVGVVGAASMVVAGSVVLVGNTVYWFEKQGKCQKKAE